VIWACQLEEAERTFQSVAAFVEAVVSAASAIASAQLNAAVGLVRHEHLAARLDQFLKGVVSYGFITLINFQQVLSFKLSTLCLSLRFSSS
jgi:hypothetical protein